MEAVFSQENSLASIAREDTVSGGLGRWLSGSRLAIQAGDLECRFPSKRAGRRERQMLGIPRMSWPNRLAEAVSSGFNKIPCLK